MNLHNPMNHCVYLFDLDDTIISTSVYKEIYTPFLEAISKKRGIYGGTLEKKAKGWGLKPNKFGRLDTGDLAKRLGLLNEYYSILEEGIQVDKGVQLEVKALFRRIKSQHFKIGIVSNSMRRTIKLFLEKYGFMNDPNFIFCREDADCKKDSLRFWRILIKKQNLNPQECLVVGDDELQDVEVPKKAGFNTFLIKTRKDIGKVYPG